jgi:hypothetical protein
VALRYQVFVDWGSFWFGYRRFPADWALSHVYRWVVRFGFVEVRRWA